MKVMRAIWGDKSMLPAARKSYLHHALLCRFQLKCFRGDTRLIDKSIIIISQSVNWQREFQEKNMESDGTLSFPVDRLLRREGIQMPKLHFNWNEFWSLESWSSNYPPIHLNLLTSVNEIGVHWNWFQQTEEIKY